MKESRPYVKAAILLLLTPANTILPVQAAFSEDVKVYYQLAMLLDPKYKALLALAILFVLVSLISIIGWMIYCLRRNKRNKLKQERESQLKQNLRREIEDEIYNAQRQKYEEAQARLERAESPPSP